MSPLNSPPSRKLVKTLAAVADVHERTAFRALVYGPDVIHGYSLRARLREAIAALASESAPEVPQ